MREESMARFVVANHPPCLVEGWDRKYVSVIIGNWKIGSKLQRMLVTMAQSEHNECLITLITDKGVSYEEHEYEMLHTMTMTVPRRQDSSFIRSYLMEHKEEISQIFLCGSEQKDNWEMDCLVKRTAGNSQIPIIHIFQQDFEKNGLLHACEEGIIEQLGKQIYYDYAKNNKKPAKWESLSEFEQSANYNSAMHIFSKLYLAGMRIASEAKNNATIQSEEEFALLLEKSKVEELARLEHMRWCAFHLINGQERHICLVPWEELEALSVRKHKDFKKEDRDRVEHIFHYVKECGHELIKIMPEPLNVDKAKTEVSCYPMK